MQISYYLIAMSETNADYLQKSHLFSNVLVAKENMPTFLQSNFSSFSRF